MQAALTRKNGQFLEIYRQIRAKVPIRVATFSFAIVLYYRVSLMFHLLRIFRLDDA
jgi:hypothetical protein